MSLQTPARLERALAVFALLISMTVALPTAPAAGATTDLILSEYVEGSSLNKAVEIYNGTGTAVDLTDYTLEVYFNGSSSAGTTVNLAGTVADGDVFVVADDGADPAILAATDQTTTSNLFNGDDAIVLRKSGGVVDSFGQVGVDPGSEWPGGGQDDTLRRNATVCAGDTNETDPFDASLEWTSFPNNTFDGLGAHVANCDGAGPTILINEVDADQVGTDAAEFVELYDGGFGNSDLSGLVLVFFNGNGDTSYAAFDLDGLATGSDGFFVLCGDAANVANCDLDVSPDTNLIQNGADAVALYEGNAADFPNGTGVSTTGLLDALVYDTSDADDAELLVLLNAGQPQVNEGGGGDSTVDSNQRCPNGSGGARNTDTYAQFAPTPGVANVCQVVVPPLSCDGDFTFTAIHDIQGSGDTTPLFGAEVYVEGIVVGDFQADDDDATDLAGFYLQEEDSDADGDVATSEGIFVFDLPLNPEIDVVEGDLVRVKGTAGEFQNQTQVSLSGGGELVVCASGQGALVTPTALSFPLPNGQEGLEQYEGMAVTVDQDMTVIEYFNLDRAGLVDVASERLEQPTDVAEPGAPAAAVQAENETNRIRLDDGSQEQNPHPVILPDGQLDFDDAFGGGDTLTGITGVLSWIRPWVGASPDRYAIQLTELPVFTDANQRPGDPPAVGGTLQVAGFNVLNYFNGDGMGGGFPTSRGADDPAELQKQTDKIVSAITGMDAAVVGLIEIENDFAAGANSAIADLVEALNVVAGAGTYAYVDPGGNVGPDEIAVAVIYQPARVAPLGDVAILDTPDFIMPFDMATGEDRNRPAMAQTFIDNDSGEVFTAVVNHFKSKSGSELDDSGAVCVDGDPSNDRPDCDQGDGQGYFNATRTAAAEELVAWLATAPTGTTDPDYLLVGDYNAYAQEDPIKVLEQEGYVDLLEAFQPSDTYTFVFDGTTGYLDYGLASESLVGQVTGAAPWNINADEPDALDYNEDFDDPANIALWYDPSAFRSSDHDPVIVGLALDAVAGTAMATPATLWPPNHKYRSVQITAADGDGDALGVQINEVISSEADFGLGPDDLPNDIVITGPATVDLRAERFALEGRTYTVTLLATSAAGQAQVLTATVFVPHDQGRTGGG